MEIVQLNKILRGLCHLTNLPISLWDSEYRLNATFEPFNQSEAAEKSFCRCLHDCGKGYEHCIESDLYGFRQAAEARDIFCYRCPFGLLEIVAPFFRAEQIIGYIMVGQGVMSEQMQDQKIIDRLLSLYPDIRHPEKYRNCLSGIPHLTQQQLDSFIVMLKIITGYIENNELLLFPPKTIGQLTKNYIQKNYANKITLAELSMYLHCSTVTLTEHFRREFGITIFTYLNRKRLEQAEKLLVFSDANITEIAEKCGFSDANYFFLQFKKKHGISPSAYRKQRKK